MVKKSYRVIITFNARTSIKNIVSYIKKKEKSASVAEKVKEGLISQIKSLQSFPEKFPKEKYLEDLPGNYRSVIKWDYKIIYKVLTKEVWVLRIIHTHQSPSVIKKLIK